MTFDKRSQVRKVESGYILASPETRRSSATGYRGTKDTSSHSGMGASTKQQHLQLAAVFVFQQPWKTVIRSGLSWLSAVGLSCVSHCQPTDFKEKTVDYPIWGPAPCGTRMFWPQSTFLPTQGLFQCSQTSPTAFTFCMSGDKCFFWKEAHSLSWRGELDEVQLLSALCTERMESWEGISLSAAVPSTCFPMQAQRSGRITSTRAQFSPLAPVGFNFKLPCFL